MRHYFLIFFVVVLIVFSCKKEEPKASEPPPHGQCSQGIQTVHLDPDISRLKFAVNSYWVYEDSIGSQTDSCFVSRIVLPDGIYTPIGGCTDHEMYTYQVTHSLNPEKDTIMLISAAEFVQSLPTFFIYLCPTYISYNLVPDSGISAYPGPLTDSLYKKDSVFIYDRFYYKVVISKVQKDPKEDSLLTLSYSNSDFGLLRKDVFNANGTLKNKWLLKNKNVIR